MTDNTELPEPDFQDALLEWFQDHYGEENAVQEYYQPGPRWYCDIRVETPYATLFVECKTASAGDSGIRAGIAQALGYASYNEEHGVPMVVVPPDTLSDRRIARLQKATTVVVREFDHEEGAFL